MKNTRAETSRSEIRVMRFSHQAREVDARLRANTKTCTPRGLREGKPLTLLPSRTCALQAMQPR